MDPDKHKLTSLDLFCFQEQVQNFEKDYVHSVLIQKNLS